MAGMGPPPKPDGLRRRRNRAPGMTWLPAGGRQGEAPAWPLPGRHTAAEREAWAQLWRTPQAVAWEELGWARTVARYCRLLVRAERRDGGAAGRGPPARGPPGPQSHEHAAPAVGDRLARGRRPAPGPCRVA